MSARHSSACFTFDPLNPLSTVKPLFRFLTLLCCLFLSAAEGYGQAVPDTSLNTIIPDSLAEMRRAEKAPRVEAAPPARITAQSPLPFQPNPKKAALYSAILPGSGQLYNREYWKIGLIYAGVGASAYFMIDNTKQYRAYRRGYVARITNLNVRDEYTDLWSPDPIQTRSNLQTLQDAYKRYLDLTVLLSVVGYALQVLDALAFAHLKNFDVSRDITLRVQPVAAPAGNGAGVGLVMRFK
jgi:hypothetical protein